MQLFFHVGSDSDTDSDSGGKIFRNSAKTPALPHDWKCLNIYNYHPYTSNMTGEKNRFKTAEQLWKFSDETLTTPDHDTLVCQLLDPECAKALSLKILIPPGSGPNADLAYVIMANPAEIREEFKRVNPDENFETARYGGCRVIDLDDVTNFFNGDGSFDSFVKLCVMHPSCFDNTDIRWAHISDIYQNALNIKRKIMDARPVDCMPVSCCFDVDIVKTEVPIISGNGFINGYWDIVIDWTRNLDDTSIESYKGAYINQRDFTRLVQVRIADTITNVYREPVQRGVHNHNCIYAEIKPVIRSFGETIRQINSYIEWTPGAERGKNVVLFTPDLRFKAQFESQGIIVISPDEV